MSHIMTRPATVAGLLIAVAVASHAYDPPADWLQSVIVDHTEPDTLGLFLSVAAACGIEEASVSSEIDAEFIRSRVRREFMDFEGALYLYISAGCIERTGGGYVFNVRAAFRRWVGDVIWEVTGDYGAYGVTTSSDDVSRIVLDSARAALTDFIYAHNADD